MTHKGGRNGKTNKRARACEFDQKARFIIYSRDNHKCIFCESGRENIKMPKDFMADRIDGVMHYIPRSKGGLGIPQNGALGCRYHHRVLDNGTDREQARILKEYFREYLQNHYPGWNEEDLYFDKWKELEEVKRK